MQCDLFLSLFVVSLTAVLFPAAVAEPNAPPSLLYPSFFPPSPLTNFTPTPTVSAPLPPPISRPPTRHRSLRPPDPPIQPPSPVATPTAFPVPPPLTEPPRLQQSLRQPDPPIQPPSPVATPTGFPVPPLLPLLTESLPRPLAPSRWRSPSRPYSPQESPSPQSSALSPPPPARHHKRFKLLSVLSPPAQPPPPPLPRSPRRSLPFPRRSRSTTLALRRRRQRSPPPPRTPPRSRLTPPQSPPRSRRSSYPRSLRPPQPPPPPPSPPPPILLQPLPRPESQRTLLSPPPPPPPPRTRLTPPQSPPRSRRSSYSRPLQPESQRTLLSPPPPPSPGTRLTPPQSPPRYRRSSYPRPLRPPQLPPPFPPPPTLLQPLPLPESQPTLSPAPPTELPLASAPLVPGLFVLGDSSVDAGTNNYPGTLARADRLPYGRDFDTHKPTGRFSNGRLPVDFLAHRLGLPFVPSYQGLNGSANAMIHGVNYASAAAGVIYASGSELGRCISFSQQIQQFSDTLQLFILEMGEKAASELISRSVFYISIGVNDYIHYYLQNESSVQNLYLPWSFSQFIATAIRRGIENLHNMYVRRVVVMGIGPLGCAPRYLWQYSSEDGGCIDEINNIVMDFNFIMRRVVQDLNQQLPDVKIIFCDMLQGSLEIIKNHQQYGFDVISDACCGLGKYNGWIMCMSPDMACEDARTHVWWDQFHPTDAVNAILADNVWNGFHSQMCYPLNLEDIVFHTSS